jgi:hypothetical protein
MSLCRARRRWATEGAETISQHFGFAPASNLRRGLAQSAHGWMRALREPSTQAASRSSTSNRGVTRCSRLGPGTELWAEAG